MSLPTPAHIVDWCYATIKQNVVVEALHAASSRSYARIMDFLIDQGADIEAIAITTSEIDRSPLHECVAQGNVITAELLLCNRANVNGQAPYILFEAILRRERQTAANKLAMTRLLLKWGADPTIRAENGDSALRVAVYTGCPEILALLLETEAVVDLDRFVVPWEEGSGVDALIPLMQTCLHRDSFATRLLLQKGADVNAQTCKIPGALYFAIAGPEIGSSPPDPPKDLRETMLALLEYGVDIDRGHRPGCTPLSWTLRCNNTAAMQLLFEAGADLENKGDLESVLHTFVRSDILFASWAGGQCLLSLGVDTNKLCLTDGHTPLTALCSRLPVFKGPETVGALLAYGAVIDSQNIAGDTPLFTICSNLALEPWPKAELIKSFSCRL